MQHDDIRLDVAQAHTNTPGGRYRRQGPGSGEDLREGHLLKALKAAEEDGVRCIVHLDGAEFGYRSGYLEEAFGGLVRRRGAAAVERLVVTCEDDPEAASEAREYISAAVAKEQNTRTSGSSAPQGE